MRAAVIIAPGAVEIRDVAAPEPAPGEVRVRLEGCGVCASNLPAWEGQDRFTYPLEPGALGHEGWGAVDALGEGVQCPGVGDRVAILSTHAYAEQDLAPADRVIPLPMALGGQPFPGEPLGCAVNVFRRSEIRPGKSVAVVGIGFLGALLTRMASRLGVHVIAISRRPFALEVARTIGAAETIVLGDQGRVVEEVKGLTCGEMCDVVVEAVGKQGPLDLAGELTRVRGRLVIAGYHQDGPRRVDMRMWNWRGIDVINAHERDPRVRGEGVRSAVDMVMSGEMDPTPLLTHRFPLERLGEALDAVRERPPGFMKAIVMAS